MTNIQNIQNPDSKFTNLNSKFLSGLPKADQDRILDALDHRGFREVLEEINQPAPEGLGLKIHSNSLRKFYLKHLPRRLAEERPDTVADWKLLSEQAAHDPIDFQDLIRESLEREVYLAFLHSEPTNPRPIKLLQCPLRWRGQDIAKAKRSGKSNKSPAIAKLFSLGGSPATQPIPGDGFPGPSGVSTSPTPGALPGFATPNPAILNMLKSMLDTARAQAAAQPEDIKATSTSNVTEPTTSAQSAPAERSSSAAPAKTTPANPAPTPAPIEPTANPAALLAAGAVTIGTEVSEIGSTSPNSATTTIANNEKKFTATQDDANQSEPVRTSMNNSATNESSPQSAVVLLT